MLITDIKVQQKDKNRASLYLDGKFHCGLYLDIIWEHRLKVGQEVTTEQLATLTQADNLQRTYSRSLDYLSRRPRTESEMRQYLKQRLIYKHPDWTQLDPADKPEFIEQQEQSIEQIIAKLHHQGHLNDLQFATWWIDNRLHLKPRGLRLIQQELRTKGVAASVVEQALADYQQDQPIDQLAQAQELATKYLKKQSEPDSQKLKQKLFRHLASKGYDWDTITQVWQNLGND